MAQQGLFSFGQPTQPQQQQPAGGAAFSFGAKPAGVAPVQPTFGSGGFSFGTPTAQQQPQQQQQLQQPGAASAFSFGNPAAQQQPQQQPQAGGLFSGFGAAAAPAPAATGGFGFGAQAQPAQQQQPAAATGFGFGATAAPTMGAAPTLSGGAGGATSFGFGTPAPAAGVAQPATGFGFGTGAVATAPAAAAPATNFGFGSTAQQPAATVAPFSFGAKLGAAAPATAPAGGGFSFGTPAATAAPTLSLGTLGTGTGTGLFGSTTPAQPAAVPSFGLGATPAAGAGLGTGLGTGLFGGTSVTTSTAPTFGGSLFGSLGATTSTASSTAPGLSMSAAPFSFGAKLGAPAAAPATSTGFSFGGFGSLAGGPTATATSLGSTLFPGVSTAAATATPSSGLGGVPKYATTGSESSFAFGGGSGDGKTENRAIQELPLPPEMLVLVDELKNQIKAEKLKFQELARTNNDPIIGKVSEEIEEIRTSATQLANLIQKQVSNCEAIRALIHEGIQDAEMANQTHETPPSAQAEHKTPIQYFFRLVDRFKERMNMLLREIEKAESSLSYVLSTQTSLTSEELYSALQTTRDAIIVLSAKVQVLHEEVVRVTEANRNLQRYALGETAELHGTSGPGTPTPLISGGDREKHGKHISFGRTQTFPLGSGTLRETTYQFPNLLDKEKESDFSKIGLLFPNKLVEPPKIAGMHLNSPSSTVKTSPPGMTAFSSTRLERPSTSGHKSSDSLFYPSHALFQTQQSTILSQTQLGASTHPSSPGISLKRSKR